eukprot:602102-Pleurochrysis_carterae.AAC.2
MTSLSSRASASCSDTMPRSTALGSMRHDKVVRYVRGSRTMEWASRSFLVRAGSDSNTPRL